MFEFEMNNAQRDVYTNPEIHAKSPIVEVFAALINGESLNRFGAKADKAVNYIKELGQRASQGDASAVSELNQIRRFVIEPLLNEEVQLLGMFGGFQQIGINESIEREVYDYVGGGARIQAINGDVTFPTLQRNTYPVPSENVSAGMAVDYRKIAAGNMDEEANGAQIVRTDLWNKAVGLIIEKIYNAIQNATGVKYVYAANDLTKAGIDGVIKQVKRIGGQPSLMGPYAMVSQLNAFAGWTDGTHFGISDAAMEEIRRNGLLGYYGGCKVMEIPTAIDYRRLNVAGTDFLTLVPENVMFVMPTGKRAPVMVWTRGGLTSFSGNDVSTGKVLTRFDLEVAVDVAKGHEFEVGLIKDTNL